MSPPAAIPIRGLGESEALFETGQCGPAIPVLDVHVPNLDLTAESESFFSGDWESVAITETPFLASLLKAIGATELKLGPLSRYSIMQEGIASRVCARDAEFRIVPPRTPLAPASTLVRTTYRVLEERGLQGQVGSLKVETTTQVLDVPYGIGKFLVKDCTSLELSASKGASVVHVTKVCNISWIQKTCLSYIVSKGTAMEQHRAANLLVLVLQARIPNISAIGLDHESLEVRTAAHLRSSRALCVCTEATAPPKLRKDHCRARASIPKFPSSLLALILLGAALVMPTTLAAPEPKMLKTEWPQKPASVVSVWGRLADYV